MKSIDILAMNTLRILSIEANRESQFGSSRLTFGRRAHGLHPLVQTHETQPQSSRLDGQGSICLIRRARLHALLCPLALVWVRIDLGGSKELPPIQKSDPWASRSLV
jgi:hypothetical protein